MECNKSSLIFKMSEETNAANITTDENETRGMLFLLLKLLSYDRNFPAETDNLPGDSMSITSASSIVSLLRYMKIPVFALAWSDRQSDGVILQQYLGLLARGYYL